MQRTMSIDFSPASYRLKRSRGGQMSIKSDIWIKRMSLENGLIDPFENRLVRAVGDRRVISCGLSSYGYDCRLARDEFKVFSPVTGTEVDPKNFDPSSLLDVPIR